MLIVKVTDGQGTSYYGNVVVISFLDDGVKFSQLTGGSVALIKPDDCTVTIYTQGGAQLDERIILPLRGEQR